MVVDESVKVGFVWGQHWRRGEEGGDRRMGDVSVEATMMHIWRNETKLDGRYGTVL